MIYLYNKKGERNSFFFCLENNQSEDFLRFDSIFFTSRSCWENREEEKEAFFIFPRKCEYNKKESMDYVFFSAAAK